MGYYGKPSAACERCRYRRLKVRPDYMYTLRFRYEWYFETQPFLFFTLTVTVELRLKKLFVLISMVYSAIIRRLRALNVLEPRSAVLDIEARWTLSSRIRARKLFANTDMQRVRSGLSQRPAWNLSHQFPMKNLGTRTNLEHCVVIRRL